MNLFCVILTIGATIAIWLYIFINPYCGWTAVSIAKKIYQRIYRMPRYIRITIMLLLGAICIYNYRYFMISCDCFYEIMITTPSTIKRIDMSHGWNHHVDLSYYNRMTPYIYGEIMREPDIAEFI